MKKYLFTLVVLFAATIVFAQPGKKPVQKQPAQSEMDKAMEEAMKGMSEEEKASKPSRRTLSKTTRAPDMYKPFSIFRCWMRRPST